MKIERDLRIDAFRGLCLVIMTIDHFAYQWNFITFQTFGFVSAAEGFVYLSGFIYSIVYLRYINDFTFLLAKTINRAKVLLKYHYISLVLILVPAFFIPESQRYWGEFLSPFYQDLTNYFISNLLLLHHPAFLTILPMYALFLVLSPMILFAFSKGMSVLILIISITLWLVSQFFDPFFEIAIFYFGSINNLGFNYLAWQLVWVLGLYLGYRSFSKQPIKIVDAFYFKVFIWGSFIGFLLLRHGLFTVDVNLEVMVSIADFGWLRVVNFIILLAVIHNLMRPIPKSYKVPWFTLLGQYSLQVYTFQVLLHYLLAPLKHWVILQDMVILKLLFGVFLMLLITIPAWFYSKKAEKLSTKKTSIEMK